MLHTMGINYKRIQMRIFVRKYLDRELINVALIACFSKNDMSDGNSIVTSDSLKKKKKIITRVHTSVSIDNTQSWNYLCVSLHRTRYDLLYNSPPNHSADFNAICGSV